MLRFEKETFAARIVLPTGETVARPIEIRTSPITGRTCRIALTRGEEREPGAESLPAPPPFADQTEHCPFCSQSLTARTPRLTADLWPPGRMTRGTSTLFPNLFPYGRYSAVSLFDDRHFVEIGTAERRGYIDSFLNCRDYLLRVLAHDPAAVYMAITQNHLPSAGGSLLHPHLQVQADRTPANHHRFLKRRAAEYHRWNGRLLFSDYLAAEMRSAERWIGVTGAWHWLSAFAPEGFHEIWGILPGVAGLNRVTPTQWESLAQGVLNAQRYFRSLGRNGYNLGLLLVEDGAQDLEMWVRITVRSNYAPWVRSDFTGFEVALGDMATFIEPEKTAEQARRFWEPPEGKMI